MHLAVLHLHGGHFGTGEHFAAQFADLRHQCFCQLFGRSFEPRMRFDIQVVNQRKNVGGSISGLATRQRAQVSQQTAQFRILDMVRYELFRRLVKSFVAARRRVAARTQEKEIHLISQRKEVIHITLDVLFLLREKLLEILRERFNALRNPIRHAIFQTDHLVATVYIHLTEMQLVEDAKVTADAVKRATRLQTTHHVHACVEGHTIASERLQPTAHVRTPLQDSHLVTLLGQKRTREQPTDAASDNMYVFFHSFKPYTFPDTS